MTLAEFEGLVASLAEQIPEEFLSGIAEIVVSPRTVTHPDREDIYTLGECIALPTTSDAPEATNSRVVLYYGSFAALARDRDDFDWQEEAWETLTHEIRHHVEWRARDPGLEWLDEAVEQNYARMAGEPFDPTFYRDGEPEDGGLFRLEDDYFMEVEREEAGGHFRFVWGDRRYRVELPSDLRPPAFLSVQGLEAPPPGEFVLVVVRPARLVDVIRTPVADQREIWAELE